MTNGKTNPPSGTETLESLKRKRAGIRAAISKVVSNVETSARVTLPKVMALKENVGSLLHRVEVIDGEMVDLILEHAPNMVEAHYNESAEFIQGIQEKLFGMEHTVSSRSQVPPLVTSPASSQAQDSGIGKEVSLVKLHIPKFGGDPLKYQEFWDSFKVTIHESSKISKGQKLAYLKAYTEDEALRALSGWDCTDSNYDQALDHFKTRFGDEELRKDALATRLLDLEPVLKSDAQKLRRLTDEVVAATRSLESLGVALSSFEFMFKVILTRKIPAACFQDFQRSHKTAGERSLKNLLDYLSGEITILERTGKLAREEDEVDLGSCGTARALKATEREPRREKGTRGQSERGTRGQSGKNSGARAVCTFCEKGHTPEECRAELSRDERMKRLASARGCFRCGREGHHSRFCSSKARCERCQRIGHIAQLCRQGDRQEDQVQVKVGQGQSGLMRTAQVKVEGGPLTMLLADTGCSRTFVREDVAKGAKFLRREQLTIEVFGGKVESRQVEVVRVMVEGLAQGSVEIEAVIYPELGTVGTEVPSEAALECCQKFGPPAVYHNLKGIQQLGLLLGDDYYDKVVTGPTKELSGGLKATRSIFGWMVHGRGERAFIVRVGRVAVDLTQFWSLEHVGVLADEGPSAEIEDVLRDIRMEDGRYWVSWPWREDLRPTENRDQAEARLRRLVSKMTDEEKGEYSWALGELIDEGYVEEAPEVPDGSVSYIPHRPVYREASTTTKMRIVFDASSKSKEGLSLNNCLLAGPSLLPRVFSVLLRFRRGQWVVIGDLAKAFLQIRLNKEDRDVTRFLWEDREFRSTSVLFGATSSPALLQTVLDFHLRELIERGDRPVRILSRILEDLYVDDVTSSFDSEEEADQCWGLARQAFAEAGMVLQKCRSNVPRLSQHVDRAQLGKKVLGLSWNEQSDELSIEVPVGVIMTKRDLASELGKVYDPIGFVTPFLTPLKILLQDVWSAGLGWDDQLSEDLQKRAADAMSHLSRAESVRIPRWTQTKTEQETSLHCFVDASGRMYAAVIYLRTRTETGVVTHLVASKARLIPPKMVEEGFSPRFELLACVLGVKLIQAVQESLNWGGKEVTFWSDSRVALEWIQGAPERWEVFVRNRVRQIQQVQGSWRYVATTSNVADIPTRQFEVDLDRWKFGPAWLREDNVEWPEDTATGKVQVSEVAAKVAQEIGDGLEELVEPQVSRWRVLVGAVKRIVHRCRGGESDDVVEKAAVKAIIRTCQSASFSEEIRALKDGGEISKMSSIRSLRPHLDGDGLLRMGGRLQNATSLTPEVKHPLLLQRSGAVDLLISFVHGTMSHAGAATTLVELRRLGYWIVKGKRSVREVVHRCRVCRRYRAASFIAPEPPLPVERVVFTRPFGITGVDLLGPLVLREGGNVWMALFTCFQVRAVHLELVKDLSADAMKRALERFCARRGTPDTIWSDHGTNFVALSKAMEGAEILKWRFIVERAPWWGGLWERLVQSVKGLLKRVLRTTLVSYEELQTVTTKIEGVMNKRPISYVWEGGDPAPLSPHDFLVMGEVNPSVEVDLRQEISNRKVLIDDLNRRWHEEYLLTVLGCFGSRPQGKHRRVPRVGEVVLILTLGPRQGWPLGVITQLHSGRDGVIRAASVRVKRRILNRAIQHLFPLECPMEEVEPKEELEPELEPELKENSELEPELKESSELKEDSEPEPTSRKGRVIRMPLRFRE